MPSEPVERLNAATYEELRTGGLSFEETGAVLMYRERTGGFRSIEELRRIPGFWESPALTALKAQLEDGAGVTAGGTADGPDGEDFEWRERPDDAHRARRLVKYQVAYAGGWRAKFDTLAEALDYAEVKARKLPDDFVYVVRTGPLRKELVTAYPQSRLEAARSLWNRSRYAGTGGAA